MTLNMVMHWSARVCMGKRVTNLVEVDMHVTWGLLILHYMALRMRSHLEKDIWIFAWILEVLMHIIVLNAYKVVLCYYEYLN